MRIQIDPNHPWLQIAPLMLVHQVHIEMGPYVNLQITHTGAKNILKNNQLTTLNA